MGTISKYVDIDPGDFGDDDLIKELEARGYIVSDDEYDEPNIVDKGLMEDLIWRYKSGYIEDALIILERMIPELKGISDKLKEK